MALEGTLRDFSFADILQLISLQRKTGVLTLKSAENVVTISFLDGCIVGASSLNQHTEDRIGLILLKRGEVTESELEAALRRQEETLQRLGRILIDHHVVAARKVREALEQQILQIVYRVFRWADGEYHFSQETDIDYDRDLLVPMSADSIIMEGARMTDEWPFIDQRIPDREAVFVKSDPTRRFDVLVEDDDGFDDLGFSFSDSPEEQPKKEKVDDDRLTPAQHQVYELVNGRDSVTELILESPFIEFETCKALADLLDRGIVRPATQEEVARSLASRVADEAAPAFSLSSLPWLAVPFLVLLGFALTVMPRNPANITFDAREQLWDRIALVTQSWITMDRLAELIEVSALLTSVYPDSAAELTSSGVVETTDTVDSWGNPYRFATRGRKLLITGTDRQGQPLPILIVSRSMIWEGDAGSPVAAQEPGVILID